MNRIELEQIEADVVIVLTNPDHTGRMRIIPFWEYEGEMKEDTIAHLALEFNEECGSGYVDAEIFDFRDHNSMLVKDLRDMAKLTPEERDALGAKLDSELPESFKRLLANTHRSAEEVLGD